jgi:phytoene desaturase
MNTVRPLSSKSPSAAIVGSGAGGLAAAIRLAAAGLDVSVFEAADGPGGKLREREIGGYRFDLGPSLFTLPELVVELDAMVRNRLGAAAAERLPAFRYERLDRSTHYFWGDGTKFIAWADPERFASDAAQATGAAASDVRRHLAASRRNYEGTAGVFLAQPLMDVFRRGPKGGWRPLLKALPRLPLFGTLHQLNKRRLGGNDKLVQLFDRYATYNGSDPFRAPAMLDVIPHLEHGIGTFFPAEGMFGITRHLHRLAEALGVQFHFNAPVTQILHDGQRIRGIATAAGEHPAEVVVSNADVHPTYRRLLPDRPAPEKILRQERSTSGLIFYWGVRRAFPELHLHNILFSEDYRKEFGQIRTDGTPGDDPTVYINITSKLRQDDAPAGAENWFVLINVEANPERFDDARAVAKARQQVIAKIERTLGLKAGTFESFIEVEDVLTPRAIDERTSSWRGALYGASSNSPFSAFLRHRNRSRDLDGLYFCGGSVHPGGGIPLCLLSGAIAAECVHEDLTRRA